MSLLPEIVLSGAETYRDKEAVSDLRQSLSYGELADRSLRVAEWLRNQGLKPGDRVMIQLPNSVDLICSHFGVMLASGISVPIEHGASSNTCRSIADSCEPAILLDSTTIDEASSGMSAPLREIESEPDDIASLLYTTGTTGRPKGVMLTHANTRFAIDNIVAFVRYTQADREVVVLPLCHSFGLGHVYCNLTAGGAVHVDTGLTRVGRVLKKIDAWGATGFPGTPLGFSMLMDRYADAFRQYCSGLRFIVINSAPLPPEQASRIRRFLPNTDLMVYYGLTEASRSTFISHSRCGPDYYGSVGKAMRGIDIKLSDEGEILISGPTVTRGYWRDERLTQAVIENGCLRTGDLGSLDPNGYLYIEGRLNDIINVGGHKVAPTEVENVLLQHHMISDACAFGTNQVEAAVVSENGFDEAECLQFCHQHLEAFKVPARLHTVQSITRSETGKVIRHAVARQCGVL